MSRAAIAASLAREDLSSGERLAAFSLASFADRENRARPGTPAAAARAGLARSRFLDARAELVRRGLVVLQDAATGRGRASTVALPFADTGPWWDGDINAELFEAVLGYSAARGPARLLVAAMAALADEQGLVAGLTTERLCLAAGIADRTYRRARATLLPSREVVLRSGSGGRGNTNCWEVKDPRAGKAGPTPHHRRQRVAPPAGVRPLMATVTVPAASETPMRPALTGVSGPKDCQDRTLPGLEHPVVTGVSPPKGDQGRTVSAKSPAETPAKTPAPHARAAREPQNPKTIPPNPPEGGSTADRVFVEETYVTERGRARRRRVPVDLNPIRARLRAAGKDDLAAWAQMRSVLSEAVGESQFGIWLAPLELVAVDVDGTLVVSAPHETRGWVVDRFDRVLASAGERAACPVRVADVPEQTAAESLQADHSPDLHRIGSPDTQADKSVHPASYTDVYNQLKEASR